MSDDERAGRTPYRGPSREAPYPLSRLSAPISLVDAAREIERAEQWIASTAHAKLDVIAAQMRALREQAEEVLRRAREDADLHRAEARFRRLPGKIYHLYERSEAQRYWSVLSPNDWRGKPPHHFLGSYRLEVDHSWTPIERLAARDEEQAPIAHWLEDALRRGD
ncbi:MAG TPA: DUF2452 domain-containing protein [Polyangiaceae bacterium]|nr:DUF2452 domain-containing protein [Polyangiaceae bacterium]